MLHNHSGQSRLPIAAMIVIAIIILFVVYLITQSNVALSDKDIEIFVLSFAFAGGVFVILSMGKDKLRMEGV